MESNKEEALRCIDIAIEKFESGNYEGGFKFLNKSNSLYPNAKAKELEQFYKAKQNNTSSSSSSHKPTHTDTNNNTSSSSSSTPTTPGSPTATYTIEQVDAIKKIKKSKNFYEILEVSKTATDSEIKKAYRKVALQLHPDKNHAPGAEDAFKMVTQAFSCLSDEKKRKNYDLHGAEDTVPNRSPFQRGGGFYYDEDISPEDVFENLFGFAFGGGVPGGNVRRRGGVGGQGFQYYSSGFSPYGGGVRFQFPQQQRRRAANQNEETPNIFNLLLIFLPLLLIFFSMISGGTTNQAKDQTVNSGLFQFEKNNIFKMERNIHISSSDIDITYYVKDTFDKQRQYYRLSVNDIEDRVVHQWLEIKRPHCINRKVLEEKLKSETLYARAEIEKELTQKKYQYCDKLYEYFHIN
ncbi:DnaJ-like protein [Tieghemostelium lacteum]|uniref:DnaJ-like protein n=1 Tax=Tieghemostelium lacteum TaxID=361077 RepID=A0A151ZS03_TIELA|nr:DnaJ-like protein [Tieghemostelium lacteum]|eukprot:KYQ96699.1 DnaJ-like protein [Tieghemostelium lacteum]